MDPRTPLILFGDGPRFTSGLARIARDVAMRLVAEADDLGIRLLQVGVDGGVGWHWQPWDFFGFQPTYEDQGRQAMTEVLRELQDGPPPIILGMTDPSRCYDLTRTDTPALRARFWGYFPIDGWDPQELIGGPAAEAVKACERVLGYGRWGAGVLRRTLMDGGAAPPAVSYLPHGIETTVFHAGVGLDAADPFFRQWHAAHVTDTVIGCVATNQPRKDLGLLFSTVAELTRRGQRVVLWLHTDFLTKAWDIGQLAERFLLQPDHVCVTIGELTDTQLAARYCASDVTIAPGLGEGFGYPIVESLACGTPVVHGRYAGGVELIPDPSWCVDPVAWRLESAYAIQRPVFKPTDMADTVWRVVSTDWTPEGRRAYCAGAVAQLDWRYLWPRWRAWLKAGLSQQQTEEPIDAEAQPV